MKINTDIKNLQERASNLIFPLEFVWNYLNDDLLKLFTIEISRENFPDNILKIYDNLDENNIDKLLSLTRKKFKSLKKPTYIDVFNKNLLPNDFISIKDLEENKKYKIIRIIHYYYTNKYRNFLSESTNELVVQAVSDKIKNSNFIEEFLSLFYINKNLIKKYSEHKKGNYAEDNDDNHNEADYDNNYDDDDENDNKYDNENKDEDSKNPANNFVEMLSETYPKLIINYSNKIFKIIYSLKNKSNKIFESLEKLKTDYNDLKNINDNLKKENKKLKSDINIKRDKEKEKIIKDIKDEISLVAKKIQDIHISTLKNSYESLIRKNTDEICDLKIKIKLFENKIKDLENENSDLKYSNKPQIIDNDNIINYISENKELLSKIITKSNLINKSIIDKEVDMTPNSDLSNLTNIKNTEDDFNEDFQKLLDYYNPNIIESINDDFDIGYVFIEDKKHYIYFLDTSKKELINLPNSIFVGNGQFVLAHKNGEFIKLYKQYTSEHLYDEGELRVIKKINGDFYSEINGITKKIKDLNFPLPNKSLALIQDNSPKKLFKNISFNADNYLESILSKNFTAYYIVKNNGYSVEGINIENGENYNLGFSNNFHKNDIVILDKNKTVINVFNNSKFYLDSSYYNNSISGKIELINGNFYLISNDRPDPIFIESNLNLKIGSYAKIDEFNRFISYIDPENVTLIKPDRKNYKKKNEKEENKYPIEIKGNVLIVSDIGMQNAYKMACLKNGYIAEVVSGHDPYKRINKLAKKADIIVIAEDHVEHRVMWELKKDFKNIIYAKSSGANSIVEQIENNIIGRKQLDISNK